MLKIVTLVENTTLSSEYRCKHGLCLYIETEKHKILFGVGLDEELLNNEQIVVTTDEMRIDEELFLFSNVISDTYFSKSNKALYTKKQRRMVPDDFCHEQNLIITANGKRVLFSGCSHTGIVNIQNQAEKLILSEISTVVGGFHLYNPPTKKYESDEMIANITNALEKKKRDYYTCHCTGIKAYKKMKYNIHYHIYQIYFELLFYHQ